MIQALVFDLGNVIVDHDNDLLTQRLAEGCARGQGLSEGRVHDPRYTTGEWPITKLHQDLVERFGYRHDYARFLHDWSCHFTLNPAMLARVQDLATRHRVMIFSNTNAPHWDHIGTLAQGAIHRFEAHLSHDMGVAKPDVDAYHALARAASIAPATSLFFDDRGDNIAGARQAGFHAEVFTTLEACEAVLARYGVA